MINRILIIFVMIFLGSDFLITSSLAQVYNPVVRLRPKSQNQLKCPGALIPDSIQIHSNYLQSRSALTSGQVNLDVGVFYSSAALAEVGGLKAAQIEAQATIDQTNQIFEASGSIQRLSLVYVGTALISENADLSVPLSSIQNPSDGIADEINILRASKGLDISVLIQVAFNQVACGLAYQYFDPNQSFPDYGFAVVARYCLPSYGFAHEIGHILGANHNEASVQVPGAYSYSRAKLFSTTSGQSLQTVMGTTNVSRVPYFSTPDRSYSGIALGDSAANNVLAMNNLSSSVSAYQPALSPALPKRKALKISYSQVLSAKQLGSKCKIIGQLLDRKSKGLKGAAVSVNRMDSLTSISPIKFSNKEGKVTFNISSSDSSKLYLYFIETNQRSRFFSCKKS